MTRLIGDVHGLYGQYKKLIAEGQPPSIQVGDMGLGFRHLSGWHAGEFTQNPPHAKMKAGDHKFIRGNHDNPGECAKNSQWIKDGTVESDMMLIGGAPSIDKEWRVKDYTWWEDEELSLKELDALVEVYTKVKPRVMITHTCPKEVADSVMVKFRQDRLGEVCRTEQALQRMLNEHRPDLWVFGHWHHSIEFNAGRTHFVCLNELEYRDDLI